MNLIEYVLKGAEDLFINASVSEVQLLPLLINQYDETNQQILKFLVKKDVVIVNDGSLKLDQTITEELSKDNEDALLRLNSNQK